MSCETSVAINSLYSFERRRVCNVSMWVHYRYLSASVALPGWVATAHTDRCMFAKQKNIHVQSRFLWFDHLVHNLLFQFLVRQTWALVSFELWANTIYPASRQSDCIRAAIKTLKGKLPEEKNILSQSLTSTCYQNCAREFHCNSGLLTSTWLSKMLHGVKTWLEPSHNPEPQFNRIIQPPFYSDILKHIMQLSWNRAVTSDRLWAKGRSWGHPRLLSRKSLHSWQFFKNFCLFTGSLTVTTPTSAKQSFLQLHGGSSHLFQPFLNDPIQIFGRKKQAESWWKFIVVHSL